MARSSSTRSQRQSSRSKNARSKDARETGSRASSRRSSIKKSGGSRLFSQPAQIMGPRLMFILSTAILCVFGLVMVYSASSISAYNDFGDSSYYLTRQSVFLVLSVVACIVFAAIPYRFWSHPACFITLWTISILMLSATAFGFGVSALGAERSIIIAGFALQPAEFAKIFVLMAIASLVQMYMDERIRGFKFIGFVAVAAIFPIILIYQQPDLGTAIILAVGIITLAALAGISWKYIAIILVAVVLYVIYSCISQPYHLQRIMSMLDPWIDPQGDGYQSIQSLYAFGSGGIFGTGLGLSRQKYLYLPYAHTDFIFAVVGEELGIFGAIFVVVLFGAFVFAGIRICRSAPDMLGCMMAGSMTVMIGFQACVNMACVTGIAPVTGKALPFLSYGGSSLVATMIMVGIILSISFRSRIDVAYERRRENFVVYEGGSAEDIDFEEDDREYASNVISLRRARRERERRENIERTSSYMSGRSSQGSSHSASRGTGRESSRGSSGRSVSGRDTGSSRALRSGSSRSSGGYSRVKKSKTGGYSDLKPKRKR